VDRLIHHGIPWLPEAVARELSFSLLKTRYDEADYLANRRSFTKELIAQTYEEIGKTIVAAPARNLRRIRFCRRSGIMPKHSANGACRSTRFTAAGPEQCRHRVDAAVVARVISSAQAKAAAASTALSNSQARTRTAILSVGLAVAGIGLVLSWIIGRGLTRPLRSLAGAMKQLASGHFDVALPGLGRTDEIGGVANAVETFKIKAIEGAQNRRADGLGQSPDVS
jgi:HAMP domain-containing protein